MEPPPDARAALAELEAAKRRVQELEEQLKKAAGEKKVHFVEPAPVAEVQAPVVGTVPLRAPMAVPMERPVQPPIPAGPPPTTLPRPAGPVESDSDSDSGSGSDSGVYKMQEDLSGSETLEISSCDTSLGKRRKSGGGAGTGSGSDSSVASDEPAHRRSVSRASSRARSRSRSTSVKGELDTLVPETELLDMHRLDVDKVVAMHQYYKGGNVPHYLSYAFDEGAGTDVVPHIPDDDKPTLREVGVVESLFTNRSKKKDSADIIKYCIYVVKKTGTAIYDAATVVFHEDGTTIGKLACVFGSVGEPLYLVQDIHAEVEDEEGIEEEDATTHAAVGDVLYASTLYSKILYEEEGKEADKNIEEITKKYHTPGCDASCLQDEELPFEQHEFSDDEKERAAKADRKKRKRDHPNTTPNPNSIGLLDCLSEAASSSSENNSEYEFNSEGEIVNCIKERAPGDEKKHKEKKLRKVLQQPTALPFHPPPPPLRSDPKKVFVSDVPSNLEWHQLAAIMGSSFGTVEEALIKVKKSKTDNSEKAYAFITFQDERVAKQATFIGKVVSPDGKIMRVMRSRPDRVRNVQRKEKEKKPVDPVLPPRVSPEPEHEDDDVEEMAF